MPNSIQILICDDHPIVRIGLKSLLNETPGMELVGEAVDGEEAVRSAKSIKPDVIIMGIVMPRKNGIDAMSEIKKNAPDIPILVFSNFSDDNYVFPAIKAGANGYLLKDSTPEELIQAVSDVYNGKSSLHPVIAQKVIQELHQPSDLPHIEDPLTAREVDVLKHVAQGLSNQDISKELKIKEGTVRIHVGNILNKLQLSNRTQAALYALRKGIAELNTN
jgi:NarL family two-component system response regulator LiaR